MNRHNIFPGFRVNYAYPERNPVAILCNGAHLWDQTAAEKLAAEDPFAVVMWPRRLAEQAAEAEAGAMSRRFEQPTITRQYDLTGTAGEFGGYTAAVTEYSDGKFEARVYIKNDLVLASGKVAPPTDMGDVLYQEVRSYYADMAAHYE